MPHRKNPPAFQEYAADILSNREFRTMSLAERGLLYCMRLECWVNEKIPSTSNELAAYLGKPESEVTEALTPRVIRFFEIQNGDLVSPDLDLYRHQLAERKEAQRRAAENTNRRKREKSSSITIVGERDAYRAVDRPLLSRVE